MKLKSIFRTFCLFPVFTFSTSFILDAETLTIDGELDVQGPVTVGDYASEPASPTLGSVRYNVNGTTPTNDLEAYVSDGAGGGVWKSLTETGSGTGGASNVLTNDGGSNQVVVVAADGTVVIDPDGDSVDPAITISSTGLITLSAPQGDISMGAFTTP